MTKPYTGGCACGAIRYQIPTEPVASVECQCRDCQLDSGTGHASHLVFSRNELELKGTATLFDMVADSGNVKTRGFCGTCGTPVYMTFAAAPHLFGVRAGTLDEPGRFKPQLVTYTVRGHAWDRLDPSLTKYEKMPPR
jgi:hypothetical protein